MYINVELCYNDGTVIYQGRMSALANAQWISNRPIMDETGFEVHGLSVMTLGKDVPLKKKRVRNVYPQPAKKE